MQNPVKQSVGKTYAQLIKFGRMLENHHKTNEFSDEHPELVLQFVALVDQQLLWTSTDDFFSVFPPVKQYADNGMWDYKSTMKMRQEKLGSHFGKNDFKHVLMTTCYENKYLHLVGIAFLWSISRAHEARTGGSLIEDFLNKIKN